ncbi:hypothetical protein [Duganella sp. P38]|uniref:hypothetical protein n=1 Tax=Duganella sp. P38 TaxID=3423949 RepID=UPI003D7AC045
MPPHYRIGTESVEIAARRQFFAAAPASFGCRVLSLPDSPATLLSVLAMPSPVMNRVLGLPGGQPLTAELFGQVRHVFRERGIPRFWIHAWDTPADAPLRASLQVLGCQPAGAWTKFECDLGTPRPPAPPTVRRARADEYGLAGQIMCDSFGMPAVMVAWMAGLAQRPAWQVYFACDAAGAPIATGALLIDGAQAWLGMAATLPAGRRRGSQQALLAVRLAAATQAGCVTASVEAEAAPPGENRPSLNNIRRAGFREVGTRWNYLCES